MAVIETTAAIVTVIGTLAGATGILYAAAQKNAIATYKTDAEALRGLNNTLHAVNDEQSKQIDTLKGGVEILRETIGAGPQLSRLTTDIATQHKEVLQQLGDVASALARIATSFDITNKPYRQPRSRK